MARKYDDLYKPQSEWERIPGGYKRKRADGSIEYQPRRFTLPLGNLSPAALQLLAALAIGGVIVVMALAILVAILLLPAFRIG